MLNFTTTCALCGRHYGYFKWREASAAALLKAQGWSQRRDEPGGWLCPACTSPRSAAQYARRRAARKAKREHFNGRRAPKP